jgi:hypothetical protein
MESVFQVLLSLARVFCVVAAWFVVGLMFLFSVILLLVAIVLAVVCAIELYKYVKETLNLKMSEKLARLKHRKEDK